MALVAHQALVRYRIDFLLVVTTQEADEIYRRILQILLLDIHRARVQTESATRAGIDFSLGDTLARMARLDTGIAQQYPEHLSENMHVTAERHRCEEQTQADGVHPPYRHEIQLVTENQVPEMVHRDCQEATATEVGREAFRQKSERENHPEAVQGHAVSERRFRGVPHA